MLEQAEHLCGAPQAVHPRPALVPGLVDDRIEVEQPLVHVALASKWRTVSARWWNPVTEQFSAEYVPHSGTDSAQNHYSPATTVRAA